MHVISSRPEMSSRYHLPMRHDVVVETIYNANCKTYCLKINLDYSFVMEYIHKHKLKK